MGDECKPALDDLVADESGQTADMIQVTMGDDEQIDSDRLLAPQNAAELVRDRARGAALLEVARV